MTVGRRIAPARFLLFLALLPAAFLAYRAAFPAADLADAAAMPFDAAALAFLASLAPLARDADAATLRRHAAGNDAGRRLVLFLTTLRVVPLPVPGRQFTPPPPGTGRRCSSRPPSF